MSAPPMGMIISTPKTSGITMISGKSQRLLGMEDQVGRDRRRDTARDREIDEILALEGDRPLRQDLLELAGGHQAAGEGQRAQDDLQRQHRHRERRDVGRREVVLGGADQRDAERAEGVAQGGPLGHGRHRHQAQRHADDRAQDQPDGDPRVVDDLVVEQRADDRQQHPQLAGPDAAARGGRRAHPLRARG